jgi:predicted amidohydrolase YtcJ
MRQRICIPKYVHRSVYEFRHSHGSYQVPRPTPEEFERYLTAATQFFHANGVTSIHHMTEPDGWNRGGIGDDLTPFEDAERNGTLGLRVYVAAPLPRWKDVSIRLNDRGSGSHMLRVGAVKGFVDGSLGSHTAWMCAEYADRPGDCGLSVFDEKDLFDWISHCDAAGIQVSICAPS